MSVKKTEIKCPYHVRVDESGYQSPQAKNVKPVKEKCPDCDEYEIYHFDWEGTHAHFRECSHCEFNEIVKSWKLTCSCGKNLPKISR